MRKKIKQYQDKAGEDEKDWRQNTTGVLVCIGRNRMVFGANNAGNLFSSKPSSFQIFLWASPLLYPWLPILVHFFIKIAFSFAIGTRLILFTQSTAAI